MNKVDLSLPTRYELSEQKSGTLLHNYFACYFCDKDSIVNVNNQDVFIRNDIPISVYYTSLNDTRSTKAINKNSFIGGIVPVIRNTKFIHNHLDGDDIIRYGRFPFSNVTDEDKQALEQKFLNDSLLFTGNFFINNPEFYVNGKSYVLVNKNMMPKYIKLGNSCNFNKNFPYGKDYAKYFEDLQNDYINNKENYDWIRVDNIYWKYIKYKHNNYINIETKLICDHVLARYDYDDDIINNNLLPFISTDLEYSDFLVQDKVAKYVSIDKYKKIGKISYKIAYVRDILNEKTDLSYSLAYKNNCTFGYKIIGNLSLLEDKEYPQDYISYGKLGPLCLISTGKQYHLYENDTIKTYDEYLNENDGNKYIIIDSSYYRVLPISYTSYDGKAQGIYYILGGIPPEKIDDYLYTYFLNDIEPSMRSNQVLSIVDNNLGYRYLMNKNGLSEDDLAVDKDNKLVLKPKQ